MNNNNLLNKSRNRRLNTIEEIINSPVGNLPLYCIKPTDLEPAIIALKSIKHPDRVLSVSSREKAMNVISAAYEWGKLIGYVTDNPMDKIKKSLNNHFLKETKRSSNTRLYNNGNVAIEIVAAYIGDTVEVARKYYVANRVKDAAKGVYIPLPK